MTINKHQVRKIAELAKLSFDEETTGKLSEQMKNILTFVEQMNTVNTDHISEVCPSLVAKSILRPDKVTEQNKREEFQEIAPLCEGGLYLVPKVIE